MASESSAPSVTIALPVDAPGDRVRPDMRLLGLLAIGYVVGVFLLTTPIAVAFLFASSTLALVLLGALGFVLVSSFTASVVLGQAYMPRNPGMASGLIVGFAIGAGGLGVTVLGWVADHWGLMVSLWISALIPLLGFALALFLPEPRAR